MAAETAAAEPLSAAASSGDVAVQQSRLDKGSTQQDAQETPHSGEVRAATSSVHQSAPAELTLGEGPGSSQAPGQGQPSLLAESPDAVPGSDQVPGGGQKPQDNTHQIALACGDQDGSAAGSRESDGCASALGSGGTAAEKEAAPRSPQESGSADLRIVKMFRV